MPIFRRKNCTITAFGIVTLCKRLYSTPVESGVLCSRLQRATIPDAVIIQFFPPEDGHVNARNMSRIIV